MYLRVRSLHCRPWWLLGPCVQEIRDGPQVDLTTLSYSNRFWRSIPSALWNPNCLFIQFGRQLASGHHAHGPASLSLLFLGGDIADKLSLPPHDHKDGSLKRRNSGVILLVDEQSPCRTLRTGPDVTPVVLPNGLIRK